VRNVFIIIAYYAKKQPKYKQYDNVNRTDQNAKILTRLQHYCGIYRVAQKSKPLSRIIIKSY